jgi:hypothetical protein
MNFAARIRNLPARPFMLMIMSAILASCGGASGPTAAEQTAVIESQTTTAFSAQVQQTTTAANACITDAQDYGAEMKPITLEWDDALKLATQTSRGQLADQIAALQAIKRKADAITVPECAVIAHEHLVKSMNASIDSLLDFMSQKDELLVAAKIEEATNEMAAYKSELEIATSAPLATAVPPGTPVPTRVVVAIPDDALPGILWTEGDLEGMTVKPIDAIANPFKGGVTSYAYRVFDKGSSVGVLTVTAFNTPADALAAVQKETTGAGKGVTMSRAPGQGDLAFSTAGRSPEMTIMARCSVAVRIELPGEAKDHAVFIRKVDDRITAICLP